MLETLQRLATWMRPAAPFFAGVAILLFALCAVLVLTTRSASADRVLMPAIAGLLWTLCGYVFVRTFESVPAPASPDMSAWRRLKRGVSRAWHWLLAAAFAAATIAALLVTNHLIREALG
ncbi:MAG: hypothetical protein K9L70_07700 [Thiohalocapsa sp.]|nr:hypothetical protein [Thiohalocapsa sp.]MCF7989662.1 hypothetical protein [Thiohalocapsa sp.]